MHNWKLIIGSLVIVALVAAAVIHLSQVNDPVFEGRKLSDYLQAEGFKAGGLMMGGLDGPPRLQREPETGSAQRAVLAVGTNAFPLLVRMVGTKIPLIKRLTNPLAEKYPMLRKFIRPPDNLPFARQLGGVIAFYHLGSRAAPAVPRLLPLLKDSDTALAAICAVAYARPETEREILSLTNVLGLRRDPGSGDRSFVHAASMFALSTFGKKATEAIPMLIDQMNSTNEYVRGAAVVALARIGAPAERVIPMILTNLANSVPLPATTNIGIAMSQSHFRDRSKQMNTWALGEYGHEARAALPALSNLLTYPLMNVREEAEAAIHRIMTGTNRVTDRPLPAW